MFLKGVCGWGFTDWIKQFVPGDFWRNCTSADNIGLPPCGCYLSVLFLEHFFYISSHNSLCWFRFLFYNFVWGRLSSSLLLVSWGWDYGVFPRMSGAAKDKVPLLLFSGLFQEFLRLLWRTGSKHELHFLNGAWPEIESRHSDLQSLSDH